MKKVLIICDLFPPAFGPRMGYLCKYLKGLGWEPTVLTEKVDEATFQFLAKECAVNYINYYPAKSRLALKAQWLITFVLDFCFGYKDRVLYKEASKLIRSNRFELILSSTYRTFPLPAAGKAARKFNLPLIVDLRDIIEQYTGNEFITHAIPSVLGFDKLFASLFKRKSIRARNRILKQANYVTTVSPWHVETLKLHNPKTALIYNGFDPETFYPEHIPTNLFIITYTGRLLSTAMRDPSLLFEALALMSAQGKLSASECRVHWYVDNASWKVIAEKAEKAGVIGFMDFKGYVSASEIPAILNRSSVLLLLTNRSEGSGPKGVMTTKFFESLAIEKPILCVRSDESCLAEALRESNAGLAATQVEEVCEFLDTYHNEWRKKGYTTSPIDKDKLTAYSRKEQAKQFVRIFEQI